MTDTPTNSLTDGALAAVTREWKRFGGEEAESRNGPLYNGFAVHAVDGFITDATDANTNYIMELGFRGPMDAPVGMTQF